MAPVRGSCLCGRFAFVVDGGFQLMIHCHCSYCRKMHGTAFATWVGAPAAGFRWVRGEGAQSYYPSSKNVSRAFCPDCGSKVPGAVEGESIFLPAGILDGDPGVRPQSHFFAGSKAPWFEIQDGLPTFEATPPEFPDPKLPTPPRPAQARASSTAGSCLCGAVAWEFDGAPLRMGCCHCSRCRKARSAAFSSNIFVAHAAFRWLQGKDRVLDFKLPGALFFGSSFCRACASAVPRDVPGAPGILIPAGSLDDDPKGQLLGHIYVGSKAPWYEIPDSLPRFAEAPTS